MIGISRRGLPCLFVSFVLVAQTAMAAETLIVDLDGQTHKLSVSGCRTGDAYYLIDATGEGKNISLVGALIGDQTYTTIDFFYAEDGEDKRAGATVAPIPLSEGAFAFSGTVDVSDGSKAEMRVNFEGC